MYFIPLFLIMFVSSSAIGMQRSKEHTEVRKAEHSNLRQWHKWRDRQCNQTNYQPSEPIVGRYLGYDNRYLYYINDSNGQIFCVARSDIYAQSQKKQYLPKSSNTPVHAKAIKAEPALSIQLIEDKAERVLNSSDEFNELAKAIEAIRHEKYASPKEEQRYKKYFDDNDDNSQ